MSIKMSTEHIQQDLTIVDSLSDEQKNQLLQLYQNEWWSVGRTMDDVDIILDNASFILGLVDKTHKLVAFCRILTDNFKYAYLYDVIVDKDYRNKGLGRKLLEIITGHKQLAKIKYIELVCRKELIPFYKPFGFSDDYGLSVAMRLAK